MADKKIQVKFYAVRIYGTSERKIAATIELRNDAYVGKTAPFGHINFYREGATVPDDEAMGVSWGAHIYQLSMPERRLDAVLAFLREEQPVYLRWREDEKYGWIESGGEATGEEEGTGG